jgi:hypothetical protein
MGDPNRGLSGRLTRLLAGLLGGEPNYLSTQTGSLSRVAALETVWKELRSANGTLGWNVGAPTFDEQRTPPWALYAFDASEQPSAGGHRSRECTATGTTQEACVREMARRLREIGCEQVPS